MKDLTQYITQWPGPPHDAYPPAGANAIGVNMIASDDRDHEWRNLYAGVVRRAERFREALVDIRENGYGDDTVAGWIAGRALFSDDD